jgi:hypothetical protein
MSRSTRPHRRVRGADLDGLTSALAAVLGPTRWPLTVLVSPGHYGCAGWTRRAAQALGTRPSVVRRCLLGRVVSARAAGRVLAMARGGR